MKRLLLLIFAVSILHNGCAGMSTTKDPSEPTAVSGEKKIEIPIGYDSRGGNWSYLWFISPKVRAVAYSPDGRYVASAYKDENFSGGRGSTFKIWDVLKGQAFRTVQQISGEIHGVAYSPDGRYLLISRGSGINVWDIFARKWITRFEGHGALVRSVAYSPDGLTILSGSEDRTLKLWSFTSGKLIRTFSGHGAEGRIDSSSKAGAVLAVAYSPNGRYALSGSDDQTLRLWDINTGETIRTFKGHEGAVRSVAFSPDGQFAVSGSEDKTLKLWEVATGREIRTFAGHRKMVRTVAYSPNGLHVLSGSQDEAIKLWEVSSGREVGTLPGHTDSVNSVTFSPNGRHVLSGSDDFTTRIWDISKTSETARLISFYREYTRLKLLGSDLFQLRNYRGVNEWIVITPDGYYNSSENGDSDVYLRLNKNLYSIIQFREVLNRPDMVESLLSLYKTTDRPTTPGVRPPAIAVAKPPREAVKSELPGKAAEVRKGSPIKPQKVAPVKPPKEEIKAIPPRKREETPKAPTQPPAAVAVAKPASEEMKVEPPKKITETPKTPSAKIAEPVSVSKPPQEAAAIEALKKADDVLASALKKPAPTVIIVDTPAKADKDEVAVSLKIENKGGGVGDIRLYLNGSAVLLDSGRDIKIIAKGDDKILYKTYPIKLVSGENNIRAIAFNSENTMSSRDAEHKIMASFSQKVRPSLYALIVGIQEFKNPRLALRYAVADAELFTRALMKSTSPMFEKAFIRKLTKPDETTRDRIMDELKKMQSLNPEDLFVFYVASHGTVDNGEYFLITSNVGSTSTERLRRDGISKDVLKELIANIPTTKKVIVLDTCSAEALGEAIQVAMLTRGMSEDTAVKLLSRAVGSMILSASTSMQEAIEGYEGHGLFTYVVSEGLGGRADQDGDGFVKTTELANYVDDEVPALAEKIFRRAQYPTISPSGMGFPIGKVK